MSDRPKRIQRQRTKGWRMPEGAIYVGRPTRWGNPFDFRKSEYCWAALSFDCRGDFRGRIEASVKAFRDWIDPPHNRRMLSFEEQPKLAGPGGSMALGPTIRAGEAPSKTEIREALGGNDLACWCPLVDKDGKPVPCHADVLLDLANPASPSLPESPEE